MNIMSAETTDRPRFNQIPEALPIPEKPKTNFPFITINGRAGTGKSSLAKAMSEDFGLQVFDVGKIFRRWDRIFGKKSEVIDYAERDVVVDQRLDENTQRKMKRAVSSDQPVIIVSRLGGWLAQNLEKEGLPTSPKVNLTVSKEIAARRVRNRERKVNPNFSKTVEQVKSELGRRNTLDFEALKNAHPDLPGNPMDPGFKNARGQRIYNINLSTDTSSVTEVKEKIYKELRKQRFLEKST